MIVAPAADCSVDKGVAIRPKSKKVCTDWFSVFKCQLANEHNFAPKEYFHVLSLFSSSKKIAECTSRML